MKEYFGKQKNAYQLSVIVPVYNVENYVKRCLASVLVQKGLSIQLIIIDDGSTDRSLNSILSFVSRNKSLLSGVLVKQENIGLSGARNAGLKLAKGKYISFLDSDDFILPQAYVEAYRLAEKETCDIVLSRAVSFDNITYKVNNFNDFDIWQKLIGENKFRVVNHQSCPDIFGLEPNTSLRVIRRDYAKKIRLEYPIGLHYEDVYLHMRMCTTARRIGLLNNMMLFYRMNRPGKITEERSEKRFDIISAVNSVSNDEDISNLSDMSGNFIVYQLTKMAFWCGRNTNGKDRIKFFKILIESFKNLPARWIDYFINNKLFDFRHRYICELLKKQKLSTLEKLSFASPGKYRIGLFLLKNMQIRLLINQIKLFRKNKLQA